MTTKEKKINTKRLIGVVIGEENMKKRERIIQNNNIKDVKVENQIFKAEIYI